jgi:DNA-nicking Smr family endonuclease
MAGTKDNGKDLRGDAELWKLMTKDVKRLPGKKYKESKPATEKKSERTTSISIKKNPVKSEVRPIKEKPKGKEVDRSTVQKLSRGQMPIEAVLDLHGMRQYEAYDALKKFINRNYIKGKRCVLVITGKGGASGVGILRQKVPEWLQETDLEPAVLKVTAAKPKDGGAGALYVLLRRRREDR